jgi:tRNA(Ile)-lysidine synthase
MCGLLLLLICYDYIIMNIDIQPGTYVVAASGGVDSMALLHALHCMAGDVGFELSLVVAHFEHGIREDSLQDHELVQATARAYGLPYIYERGFLGRGASEAQAREARYAFLRRVRAGQGADAIITAHHQDDVLETAVINMVRGTGSRGLSSLRTAGDVVRPLLGITKDELRAYAQQRQLVWREDSTNEDERYLRNYIRRQLMPKLTPAQRTQLLGHVLHAAAVNGQIETLLAPHIAEAQIERLWFAQLPHAVAKEAMAAWLRTHGASFDRKTIERLVVFAKTALPGKVTDVDAGHQLGARKKYVVILSSL